MYFIIILFILFILYISSVGFYRNICISNYLKLLKVTKHVIKCCQKVSEDLVYIEKNISVLTNSLVQKALKGNLNEDDEKVLNILENQDLQEITEKLNTVADKVIEIQNQTPFSEVTANFSKVLKTRDSRTIIHFFLNERDLEKCKSVYFVKKQIQKVLE